MNRMYAAAGRLVHDPATGLTHQAPHPLPEGRLPLPAHQVDTWPLAHPAALNRPMPISVCWSPIVRCNLHCPHCLDDTTVPEQDAPRRQHIAGILAACGVLGVDISGGEPLLLRELPTLIHTIRDGGRTAVSLTTNGWHLTRRAPELAGVVDAIRVSLDGPDPASHDHLRGPGSFHRAASGIRAATAAGIPIQLQTVLMAANQHTAQQIIDLATQLGAGGVTFLQMLPIGAGHRLPAQMLTDAAARDLLANLRIPTGLRVRLRTRASASGFTVIRADGHIWRNDHHAQHITSHQPLTGVSDLARTDPDGSA